MHCYCTAKWKASYINTFFPKPLSTSSLLFPLSETEKQPNILSKPGGKAFTYCGFKSLLNYGAAAPSPPFLMSISLTFNTFAKRHFRQPGSRGSSHMPHMYGKELHPTVSEGGQSGSEDLPWLELCTCLPLNFFLPLPSSHQIWHPTCEKCSL